MENFEMLEHGQIALIQQTKEGRVLQVGLTTTQSKMLQSFLGILSKESPLVQMGEDWDLILKKSTCEKCRSNGS
jgi:hypothetical protein